MMHRVYEWLIFVMNEDAFNITHRYNVESRTSHLSASNEIVVSDYDMDTDVIGRDLSQPFNE